MSAQVDKRFDAFVTDAYAQLFRAARLMAPDGRDAEDLVQETLIRTYRAWDKIEDRRAAYPYAYRTLARLSQRHLRRAWVRRESLNFPEREMESASEEQASDLQDQLRRALKTLPARQRMTAVLRFYLDLPVEQCATIMGCSVGTVKSQTNKALGNLRRVVTESDQSLSW